MQLLDSECVHATPSDRHWLATLDMTLRRRSNSLYSRSEAEPGCFVLQHYAASVTYSAEGACEQNAFLLPDGIANVLRRSACLLLRGLQLPPSQVDGAWRTGRWTASC